MTTGPVESLADAFTRLGVKPMPSIDELKLTTEEERHEAVAASSLSADQMAQLPAWYRARLRRRAQATIARRAARDERHIADAVGPVRH